MSISRWLIEYGYVYILSVNLGLLLILTMAALVSVTKEWTVKEWLALSSLFVLVVFLLNIQPYFQAHVYNDEFYYASIGQNIAQYGRTCPLVFFNSPNEVEQFDYFQPPYPQGWPYLIGVFNKMFFHTGVGTGSLPIWYRAALLNKLLLAASIVVLFVFLRCLYPLPSAWVVSMAMAFLPFLLHLAQGASAELAALSALIIFALACLSCSRSCNWLNCLWLALSGAWLMQMRPEGTVALALIALVYYCLTGCDGLKKLVGAWQKVAVAILVLFIFGWSALWAIFVHPPQLGHHFVALARPGLTIWQNRAFNLLNDGLYFIKNQGWPLTLTILAFVALVGQWKFCKFEEATTNKVESAATLPEFQAKIVWGAALWLFLMTLFFAWYPFGDYACVYSLDSWRFAYVAVVPMAALASCGFMWLWRKNLCWRWVACLLAAASITPYFLKAVSFTNPTQTTYDMFLQNAIQTSVYNKVPLVLPDSHLFCAAVYRWGGQAYVVKGLADYNSQELAKWRLSWPENCQLMVVCLYPDKDDNYNLELWEGWKINLLSQEPSTGAGLFLLQKDIYLENS